MADLQTFSPRVSILIPVYNREALVGECIQSALFQTFTDFEVIIVDNASTDNTWGICQRFAEQDKRVRVFRNEKNIGPVRNWRRCVEEAKGIYGKILWSDDLISPDFLKKTLPLFDDSNVGFVFTQAKLFGEGQPCNRVLYRLGETRTYPTEEYILGDLRGKDYPFSPGNALFRMCDLCKNLMVDIPNSVGSDFSMHAIGNDLLIYLLTAHSYTRFGYVAEPLAQFRTHSGSISISAERGKLSLHYNIARAYFVECYRPDLKRILNAHLWLHMLRNRNAKNYGVKRICDFYVESNSVSVSLLEILWSVVNRFGRVITKAVSVLQRDTGNK